MKRQIIILLLVTISMSSIGQISATATSTDEYCGQSNGTATVIPSGNCPTGFTYLWNSVPPQVTVTATGLPAGTYTVTVYCDNDSAMASVVITNIPGGTVTATSTNENCGNTNGTASSTPIGGTAPYTYLWSNSQTLQNIINLPANTYTVTVTDANGCTASASTTVSNIAGPSLQVLNIINEICSYGNGSATVNAINGLPPYSYLWSNGNNTATALNLNAGTYTCTVTDANGCTASASVVIINIPGPVVSASPTNPTICIGDSISLTATSSNIGTNFIWSPSTGLSATNVANVYASPSTTTTYFVIGTDGFGCTGSTSVTVYVDSCSGISENENENNIQIFQNPVDNKITIQIADFIIHNDAIIAFYDIKGQLMLQQPIKQNKTDINISGFAKGNYILKINYTNMTFSKKIIKE